MNDELFELDEYPDGDQVDNLRDISEDEGDFITLVELMTLLEGKQQ